MRRISTSELIPGMVIAEDVLNYNNQLILPKGLVLNDKAITKLEFYAILQVRIEDEVEAAGPEEVAIPAAPDLSHSEKVRQSPEFIKFEKEFKRDVDDLKNTVKAVVNMEGPLDVNALMNTTVANIISPERNSTNVFDMLHCMREFDDATYVHCLNVALICNTFGKWLHMSEEDLQNVTLAGLLHDIGKTRLPDDILFKPGKLTAQEYSIVKTHPQEGFKMLLSSKLPPSVRNAVMMHHERCDGSGYPLGLKGDQIDDYAKIVSIADVYDAMTSARIYRGPLCPFKAIALFESEGLQKYDVHYVMTFLENIVNIYLLNRVVLNNGVTGKIVFINKDHLSSPTIQTDDGQFIDLRSRTDLFIEDII